MSSVLWHRQLNYFYYLLCTCPSLCHLLPFSSLPAQLTIGVGDREGKLGTGMSPRLGKREIRRSRTLAVRDDSEMVKCKQKPVRVADALKVGQDSVGFRDTPYQLINQLVLFLSYSMLLL